jgi:hemerythrin-like domain-containing protein
VSAPTKHRDVVDILLEDHREFERYFAELETGLGDPERRRAVADVVIAELVRHAVAEEAFLYPAAREKLPNGNELADHEIEEHSEAEEIMKRLEGVDATDPQFSTLVHELATSIRHHLEEEETKLFPALRAACDHEVLVKLGKQVEAAKKVAPTRPHPSAPDTPPMNMVLAPGVGLVDRVRDALSGRPTSPSDL